MTNTQFHIISLKDSKYLVIPKCWKRPEYYLDELALELKSLETITEVYFDFLIKNGLSDRFYKASFNLGSGRFTSFTKANVDNDIKARANDFFSNNLQLLEKSSLTKAQKYLLNKELSIHKVGNKA